MAKEDDSTTQQASKPKRSFGKGSKTFKALVLSTVLLVLPFAFYWFVQIQKHSEYEQEKIYRTLRELELHLTNEINALSRIEKVLPSYRYLKDDLKQFLSTPKKPAFSGCSLKLLAGSDIAKFLNLNTNTNIKCDWNDELVEELGSLVTSIGESEGVGSPEYLKVLDEFAQLKGEFAIDIRQELAGPMNSVQSLTNRVCQPNNRVLGDRRTVFCTEDLKLNNLINDFSIGGEIGFLLDISHSAFQTCSRMNDLLGKQKQFGQIRDACDRYQRMFRNFLKGLAEPELFGIDFTEANYSKLIDKTTEAINTVFDTLALLTVEIRKKNEKPGGEPQVKKALKAEQLQTLYTNIVSDLKVCTFSSDKIAKSKDTFLLVSRKELLAAIEEEDSRCAKILQGDQVLIHRTEKAADKPQTGIAVEQQQMAVSNRSTRMSRSSLSGDKQFWLAVGIDTILTRYRSSLTYLEDVYLTNTQGRVIASFSGANKKTNTITMDRRVNSLKPVISRFQATETESEDDDKTGKDNSSGNSNDKKASAAYKGTPPWAFSTDFILEGEEYSAMVKPLQLSVEQRSRLDRPSSHHKLLIVGIQKSKQLRFFTDRLSPLFHLTVLFFTLLLLLSMPVIHVFLARSHNSYSAFNVKLYRVAIILLVVVSVIGVLSYLTMLKQNIYSAAVMQKSAERLISDWEKERDASIEFLESADRCVFNQFPFSEDANKLTEVDQSNCPAHFQNTNLFSYQGYDVNTEAGAIGTESETLLYPVENALPMMGLVFVTNKEGFKMQPDWMSREFLPLKNENVDLSKRNYFQRLAQKDSWRLSENNKAYFVERIYNYIDGRKVTQLSIKRTNDQGKNSFNGIVSGEILALSLDAPVLLPGMQYAVIENATGTVLFHSENERALVENFYTEMEDNDDFMQALQLQSEAMEMIVYRSKKLLAYSKPVPDTGWSLILIYDTSAVHSVVNEVAIGVMVVILFLLLLVTVLMSVVRELNTLFKQKFIEKPKPKYDKYRLVNFMKSTSEFVVSMKVSVYFSILFLFAVLYIVIISNASTEFVLFVTPAYLILLVVFSRKTKIESSQQHKHTSVWLRTRPFSLCLFLTIWMGVPSAMLFMNGFKLGTYQIESYNYLTLQKALQERFRHIENYRQKLWYSDSSRAKQHFMSAQQIQLGYLPEQEYAENRLIHVDYGEYGSGAHTGSEEHGTKTQSQLGILDTSVTQGDDYGSVSFCLQSQIMNPIPAAFKAVPPLGELSHIAYNIGGQKCKVDITNKVVDSETRIPINVTTADIGQIWGWGASEAQKASGLHRITRLQESEKILFLLFIGLIVGFYLYARILIAGIWSRYWSGEKRIKIDKDNVERPIPRHRLLISPSQQFVQELVATGKPVISDPKQQENDSLKESGPRHLSLQATNRAKTRIELYLDIDLATMVSDKRQLLLRQLEMHLQDPACIIWLTAEIPPLYRLMKVRAYPEHGEKIKINQAEILRWCNVFKRFYKDYHTGKTSYLKQILRRPLLEVAFPVAKSKGVSVLKSEEDGATDAQNTATEKQHEETINGEIVEVVKLTRETRRLINETHAFYPDLCWIGGVIQQQSDRLLSNKHIVKMTSIYAGAYYRFKWEECTLDERMLLYQIASGRYPSPKNAEAIEHLLRRGYIVSKPFLKITNKSFKKFILNAELEETFDEWESQAEQSSWQQMRIYFGVVLLLILAWLAYTSQDTYQQIAYILGSLLAVFTALTQGANLLRFGKGGSDSG